MTPTPPPKKTTSRKPQPKEAGPNQARKRSSSTGAPTTKPSQAKNGIEPAAPSMSMIRVGGNDYPLVSSPSCLTCQSPHRRWIENEVLNARSYVSIAERLQDMPMGRRPHPSDNAISEHVKKGHTPTPARVRRQIIDRRVEALGSAMAAEENLVDHVIVNDLILQRGYERLMAGEIEPSMSDLANAVMTRLKIEQTSDQGYDVEAFQSALIAYMETAVKFIPPEMLTAYGKELNRHPILLAIKQKQDRANAIDVDSVEVGDPG